MPVNHGEGEKVTLLFTQNQERPIPIRDRTLYCHNLYQNYLTMILIPDNHGFGEKSGKINTWTRCAWWRMVILRQVQAIWCLISNFVVGSRTPFDCTTPRHHIRVSDVKQDYLWQLQCAVCYAINSPFHLSLSSSLPLSIFISLHLTSFLSPTNLSYTNCPFLRLSHSYPFPLSFSHNIH